MPEPELVVEHEVATQSSARTRHGDNAPKSQAWRAFDHPARALSGHNMEGVLLAPAVSPGSVEVDENISWLRTFAGSNDTAILQFIHNARGPPVSEAKPALQQRYARLLFAPDNFDTLVYELLVFITTAFLVVR